MTELVVQETLPRNQMDENIDGNHEDQHTEEVVCQPSIEDLIKQEVESEDINIAKEDKNDDAEMDFFRDILLPITSAIDNNAAINYLKQNNLLKENPICTQCSSYLNWSNYKKVKDCFGWKCMKKDCKKYNAIVSIRDGSYFARSNISLKSWIHVMYLWSIEESESRASLETRISKHTMVSLYTMFREICTNYLLAHPITLGGPDVVIEVDISQFSPKPRRPRNRRPTTSTSHLDIVSPTEIVTHDPIWVLGIVDTSVSPCIGYMEIIPRSDAETLLPIIQAIVRPGSIIHSDESEAYKGLQRLGFIHHTINRSVKFTGPNGVHKCVELYWNKQKAKIKAKNGCRRKSLHCYLQEFMWRDRFGSDAFRNLCLHMAVTSCSNNIVSELLQQTDDQ